MKKLVYSLAALFCVALVSCGGNKAAEATDSADSIIAAEEVVDTVVDSANGTETVVEAAAVEAVEAVADSAK